MNPRTGVLLTVVAFAAVFFTTVDPVWSRGKGASCHNCIEDSGKSKHSCSSAQCEGGDNCFTGCDHLSTSTGGCFSQHEHCDGFLASNTAVLDAIARNDGHALRQLIASHPTAVLYNDEREAIQLLDCDKHVIDHIPVSADLSEALDDE